jgi:hypothetical protein
VILVVPATIFLICIFGIRFYMISEANAFDKHFSFMTIFLNCLKFWDSSLLIKAYFGSTSQDELMKRITDKRDYLNAK